MRAFVYIICMLPLAACAGKERDYGASAACAGRGYTAGTPDFERCVKDERAARLMKENKREFEQRQRDEEYWRSRRSIY